MPREKISYQEPLQQEELLFLERKAAQDKSNYYRVLQYLMIGSFLIPFAGAWHRAFAGAENAFSPLRYFIIVFVLVSISVFATYVSYITYLRKIQLDIRDKTKTIEKKQITKKVHVPSKGTFYFYINSTIKLSIEVSQDDFLLMNVGDEVSIEYTSHSREYLGYF